MSRNSAFQNFAPNLGAEEEEWRKELRYALLVFAQVHL